MLPAVGVALLWFLWSSPLAVGSHRSGLGNQFLSAMIVDHRCCLIIRQDHNRLNLIVAGIFSHSQGCVEIVSIVKYVRERQLNRISPPTCITWLSGTAKHSKSFYTSGGKYYIIYLPSKSCIVIAVWGIEKMLFFKLLWYQQVKIWNKITIWLLRYK